MLVDQRLVVLCVLALLASGLAFMLGWHWALGILIVGALAWSMSPLNGPSNRM